MSDISDFYESETENNGDSDTDIYWNTNMQTWSDTSDDELMIEDNLDIDNFIKLPPETNFSNECPNTFNEKAGPKNCTDTEPMSYFHLFFTDSLFNTIVTETNRYAEQYLKSEEYLKDRSRAKSWEPVTVLEIKAFVAVLLEMGITRRTALFSYWTKNSKQIPWFGKMFSRDRFQLILKFFSLVDSRTLVPPSHSEYNPCAKFNFLVEHANNTFNRYYIPHCKLCVYESFVGSHCQCARKRYLSNKKHNKWGINFWMLCDAISHYCLSIFCYQGKKSLQYKEEIEEYGLGYVVVEKLLENGNYLNKGYHLFLDKFFTSIHLARALLQTSTYLTGITKLNREYIPNDAKMADVGQPKYFHANGILLCSYKNRKSDKKPIVLISTKSNTNNVLVKKEKTEVEKEKPFIVYDYNKNTGCLYNSDKMLYAYIDERKTLKYWKKVVFNIFGTMLLNAYVLFSHNSRNKAINRLQFVSKIIESIENEWLAEKNISVLPSTSKNFGLEKLPGSRVRRCVVCSNKNGNGVRRTTLICTNCKKGLHGVCFEKHICD